MTFILAFIGGLALGNNCRLLVENIIEKHYDATLNNILGIVCSVATIALAFTLAIGGSI